MTEDAKPEGTEELPPEEQDEAVELASLAVDDGKGGKMVPLSALIGSKKTQRELQKRIKELEPIADDAKRIGGQLAQAQPIINAVLNNPKLLAEANRIAQGTRVSADETAQPEDADAIAMAEEMGFYMADNQTPDAARGARVLARLDARHGKQTDERIKPLAGVTLNSAAERNIQAAIGATDEDGTPWATRESIDEVLKQLPKHMLADPQVSNLILTQAIGVDRMKKRSPKPPDEPLFMERQGGGRQREAPLSAQEKAGLQRLGLTEKEYRDAGTQLATGRGIELGK